MPARRSLRPVALILRRRVKSGCRGAFESALRQLVAVALATRGHLDVHVLWRVQDSADDYIVVHRFADAAGRQEFTGSLAYRDWLQCLRELTEESPLCPDLTELAFPESGRDHVLEMPTDRLAAPPNFARQKTAKSTSRPTAGAPSPSSGPPAAFLFALGLIGVSAEILEGMALGWIPVPPFNLGVALAIVAWLAAVAFCLEQTRALFRAIVSDQKSPTRPGTQRPVIPAAVLESTPAKR